MDSPSGSDRPHSAEGTSTRPNPFDDSDATSRKRRRTGSPVGETESNPAVVDAFSKEADDFDNDDSTDVNRLRQASNHDRRPSSNRVTLNLRQSSLSSLSSESSSPKGNIVQQLDDTLAADETSGIQRSVEDAPDEPEEFGTGESATMITPSSDRERSSPDVTSVHDEGEFVTVDQSTSPSILRDFTLGTDAPVPDFPFSDEADSLEVTLRQITTHIARRECFRHSRKALY